MKYIISPMDDSIKEVLIQIDLKLSQIEVRGDSVVQLYHARAFLKSLSDSIEEKMEEEKETKEE